MICFSQLSLPASLDPAPSNVRISIVVKVWVPVSANVSSMFVSYILKLWLWNFLGKFCARVSLVTGGDKTWLCLVCSCLGTAPPVWPMRGRDVACWPIRGRVEGERGQGRVELGHWPGLRAVSVSWWQPGSEDVTHCAPRLWLETLVVISSVEQQKVQKSAWPESTFSLQVCVKSDKVKMMRRMWWWCHNILRRIMIWHWPWKGWDTIQYMSQCGSMKRKDSH